MPSRLLRSIITIVILTGGVAIAGTKPEVRVQKIGNLTEMTLGEPGPLTAAVACSVSQNSEIISYITWIVGEEWYKSYMDPAVNCQDPYPYEVTAVNLPMIFFGDVTFTASVDIETVDQSVPGCPRPGALVDTSAQVTVEVLDVPADGGLYMVWIPFEQPVEVNGPFFAGFFIYDPVDAAAGGAVLIDSDSVTCISYNRWYDVDGWTPWYDLVADVGFPGRLAMEVSGIAGTTDTTDDTTGGNSDQPAPGLAWLEPASGSQIYGTVDFWSCDTAGSDIIQSVTYEYSSADTFVEIGTVYDGFAPIRNGVNAVTSGNGYYLGWSPLGLDEGTYALRATMVDTLGRSSSGLVIADIEPTPPRPRILSPDNADDLCAPTTVRFTVPDEDATTVELYRFAGRWQYSVGLTPMSQLYVGDANGNNSDGNLASNGEFGSYYCGPVAATIALKSWSDRGITGLIASTETMETVAEQLAVYFDTRANKGTYDHDLLLGLQQYSAERGSPFDFVVRRLPDYFELRSLVENEQYVSILGVCGSPGAYVAVDGFTGWTQADGSYFVRVANPLTGTTQQMQWRDRYSFSEIFFNGGWHAVDIAIGIRPKTWTVTRVPLGADRDGGNGWSIDLLSTTDMLEDSLYFLHAVGRDAGGHRASSVHLIRYNCSSVYLPGDYNDDGEVDLGDLFLLSDFITMAGPPPVGGGARADANCDNYVNITDIVYFINYLFGNVAAPCY
jgi:hypothetical protein